MATRQLLAALTRSWQDRSGQAVAIESVGGVDAAKRVQAGEAFDLVVLASDAIDKLMATGCLEPGSRVDLVRSGTSVAVPAGAAWPDISHEDAVRAAVLAAPTLGYSTGPSGVALAKLFERWGIAEQVQPRIVTPPPGTPVGALIARGEVALGFQQLSELIHVPGIDIVGPLPPSTPCFPLPSARAPPTQPTCAPCWPSWPRPRLHPPKANRACRPSDPIHK